MTRENSSHIHHDAKLTLFSFGLLRSGLIMVRSQFVPTDKQHIHNSDGGYENVAVCLGSTERYRHSPCHAVDQVIFRSVRHVFLIPSAGLNPVTFRCLSGCRGYLERSSFSPPCYHLYLKSASVLRLCAAVNISINGSGSGSPRQQTAPPTCGHSAVWV